MTVRRSRKTTTMSFAPSQNDIMESAINAMEEANWLTRSIVYVKNMNLVWVIFERDERDWDT